MPDHTVRTIRPVGLAVSTLGLLDYVWPRIRGRLEGITDVEYLWEPAPRCWSVRLTASGTGEAERADPPPEPPPVTSMAWRTWHIGSECLGGFAERLFGLHPLPIGPLEWFPNANSALEAMDRAWSAFSDGSHVLDDEAMAAKLEPDFGPWAAANHADAVLHVVDEIVHHGADRTTS